MCLRTPRESPPNSRTPGGLFQILAVPKFDTDDENDYVKERTFTCTTSRAAARSAPYS